VVGQPIVTAHHSASPVPEPPASTSDGLEKTEDKVANPAPTSEVQSPANSAVLSVPMKQLPSEPVSSTKPKQSVSVSVAPVPVKHLPAAPAPTNNARLSGASAVPSVPAKHLLKEKHQRATQPWELRQEERNALEKARMRFKENDPIFAVRETWKVIKMFLRRVTGSPKYAKPPAMIEVAFQQKLIDADWKDKLKLWGKVRNEGEYEKFEFDPWERVVAEDMVNRTPDLFSYIRRQMQPQPPSLFVTDPMIKGIAGLVTVIQTGSPHPLTKKPVRALRFRPVEDAKDMLIMQLLMVLRDVRYYTPDNYRWTTSPIFARVSNDLLGYCHAAIRGHGRHQLNIFSPEETTQVVDLLKQVVLSEVGSRDCSSALVRAFEDAQASRNGDYPAGLKLNPKRT
ncbi:MAG: hypothetical protein M3440_10795, partial [Chloroflexota bacterium]|nr:hypothetical protein [Chloroflexota bacterium]